MTDDKVSKDKQTSVNPVDLPIPDELPVLQLNDFVFFPGMGFPLQISNESSKQLIDDALLQNRLIAVVSQKKISEKGSSKKLSDDLYSIGVVCYIHKLIKSQEGLYQVVMSAVKKLQSWNILRRNHTLKPGLKFLK